MLYYYGLLLYTNEWYNFINKICVGRKTPRDMRGVKTLQPLAWTVSSVAAAESGHENADPAMLDSCTAGTLLTNYK